MYCAVVDLQSRRFNQRDLEELAFILGRCGVHYLRIFLPGWGGAGRLLPFKRDAETGKFDLNRPNAEYDLAVREVRDIFHRHHIRIHGDLFDQCQYRESWNAFRNNINDIHNIYDYRPEAMEFWKHHWIDRWLKVLDVEKGDRIGLGNELRFPGEKDVALRKEWAEQWGFGLAKYLIDKGVERPIYFSASKESGHKLHGYISGEEHPELDSGKIYSLSCFQIHGVGIPEHLDYAYPADNNGKRFSSKRLYAYSDDGVGCCHWNKVPEGKRGICATGERCCSANSLWRVETVQLFWEILGRRLESVEFLPREIAGDEPLSDFNVKVSANIYPRLAKAIWGVDIKREIVFV